MEPPIQLTKYLPPQSDAQRRKATEVRQQAYDQIWDAMPDIIKSMIDSARGLHYQEIDDQGVINVYTEKPDVRAAKFLVERVMGGTPKASADDQDEKKEDFEGLVMRRMKEKMVNRVADRQIEQLESAAATILPEPEGVQGGAATRTEKLILSAAADPRAAARKLYRGTE